MQSSANRSITQRQLILIRHAKAVEEDAGGDHARGLNERGRADAAALGQWLRAKGWVPDAALCSTATRTRQTLALALPNTPTLLRDAVYLASAAELLAQIQATDDAVNILALICHNPGAHGLLALLVGSYENAADADKLLLKFPTSACAVLTFSAPHWSALVPHSARLQVLRY